MAYGIAQRATRAVVRNRPRARKAALLLPLQIWVAVLLVVPYGAMGMYSVWQMKAGHVSVHWNLENFGRVLGNPTYDRLLLKTALLALIVGVIATILGLALALFVKQQSGPLGRFLFMASLAPLLVDYLTRIFAWQSLLGSGGVLNRALEAIGLVQGPVTALSFSLTAVTIILASVTVPFAFIPIYTAIERLPRELLWAANDLGAGEFRAFTSVTLPLILPGCITGFGLAFIFAVGDYLTPSLAGGTSGFMYGNVIESQIFLNEWTIGAAMSVVLFIGVMLILGGVWFAGTRKESSFE